MNKHVHKTDKRIPERLAGISPYKAQVKAALKGRDPKVWHADMARIKGYPKSAETFAKRRDGANSTRVTHTFTEGNTFKRTGIPDGWAGRKDEMNELRDIGRAEAPAIVEAMVKDELVPDDELAREALAHVVAIIRAPVDARGIAPFSVKDRLAAANTILNYTKSKPVTKTETKVTQAEDFLSAFLPKAQDNEE